MTPYYEQDGITIYHAQCEDVLPSIDPKDVGLLLTDPPYGIALKTNNKQLGRQNSKDKNWPPVDWPSIAGDDRPFDPAHLLRFKRLVLFGANNYASRLPERSSWWIWDKLNGLESKQDFGFNNNGDAELIWTNLGGPVRIFPHRWMGIMRESEVRDKRVHPTQKPVALMRSILERYTKPGDLVLDPYMGSGPVAKACLDLGRRYIGVEIEQQYVDAAIRRLQQSVLPLIEVA